MSSHKPMLALSESLTEEDLHKLRYPMFFSPKIDGLRLLVEGGVAYSRNGIPFRNRYLQEWFQGNQLDGLDGEVVVGSWTEGDVCDRAKAVTAFEGTPDFTFLVFDRRDDPSLPFRERLMRAREKVHEYHTSGGQRVRVHGGVEVFSPEDVLREEALVIEAGYEGGILRSPDAPYKFGRSTFKEQGMLKLKRFVDEEFEIVRFVERMHNTNEAQKDAFGHTKRSSAQEGMVPADTLGYVVCRDKNGLEFGAGLGKGIDAKKAKQLWEERERYENNGSMATIVHFPYGAKDKARHGKFKGVRPAEDL